MHKFAKIGGEAPFLGFESLLSSFFYDQLEAISRGLKKEVIVLHLIAVLVVAASLFSGINSLGFMRVEIRLVSSVRCFFGDAGHVHVDFVQFKMTLNESFEDAAFDFPFDLFSNQAKVNKQMRAFIEEFNFLLKL